MQLKIVNPFTRISLVLFLTWTWSKTSDSGVGIECDILIEGKRSLDRDISATRYGDGVGVELLQVDDRAVVSLDH